MNKQENKEDKTESLQDRRRSNSQGWFYPEPDAKLHIKAFLEELKESLINPNTKSKNFIEISDFEYHLKQKAEHHFGREFLEK